MIVSTLLSIAIAAGVVLDSPEVVWSYSAKSTLYASPLTADMHASPGLETVISDSEAQALVCLDAKGVPLWTFGGVWTKRLTSGAALSTTARKEGGTLAVAGSDGLLVCLDAGSGAELWRATVGEVTWGAVTWADLNGDLRDELVVGTDENGIHAFRADGELVWRFPAEGSDERIEIRSGIAVADVEWNGIPEIFAMDHWGPLCLYGNGQVKWHRVLGMDFVSAPAISDVDGDNKPELYAVSRDTNGIYCFDADTGDVRWRVNMIAGADTYSGANIAVGDLDQDGHGEVVASDEAGHVYCLTEAGDVRWVFPIHQQTHSAPSLGDVDGDGLVEVLVAGGDHRLYCLSADGHLEWDYVAGLRLMAPATITDVNRDGLADIIFGGSDATLLCLTVRGVYREALMPWPTHRRDAARSGSAHSDGTQRVSWVEEELELLANGGFELAQRPEDNGTVPEIEMYRAYWPRGWNIEDFAGGTWRLDPQTKFDGEFALKVFPREEPITVTSDWIPVEAGLASVEANIIIQGGHLVALRWFGLNGLIREDALKPFGARSVGDEVTWYQFALQDLAPPPGARWVAMALTSEAKGGPTFWDEATLVATYRRLPSVEVLVNQVGYDRGAPKRVVVQSNVAEGQGTYRIENEAGETVHEGKLAYAGRVVGAYDSDWGYEYYTGDFSEFDMEGTYAVVVELGGATGRSPRFQIAHELLWQATSRLAHEFFYYQRCGMAIPGFHAACHLDDAVGPEGNQMELWGGWHDAGDYNTYSNAPYVYGLARAYAIAKGRFDKDDRDANGLADFLDEILWGGAQSRRMIAADGSRYGEISSGYGFWGSPEIETDNVPGTGDERPIRGAETGNDSSMNTAAMARIARFVSDKAPWVEAAERGLAWAEKNQARGPLQCSAVLDLYIATGEARYAELAKATLPAPSSETVDLIEAFDAQFGTNHSDALRDALVTEADALLSAAAGNPFGLYPYQTGDSVNYFGAPIQGGGWHVGNSSHVLQAASVAALAYRYTGDDRYRRFAYDQINWVLGVNPFAVCLMEAVGSVNLPSYHHRYAFGGVARGAVPGGIPNGVTWRDGGDDRPFLDLRGVDIPRYEPNEVWLPHNTAYLLLLARMYGPVEE